MQPVFEQYVAGHGLADRLKFHGGDFFAEELPSADVLVMGHILHDWNLEKKKMLLDKAYRALPDGGSLIVYESLIDDDRSTNAFGLLMSLNMLIEFGDAFDFTGAEFREWCSEAGFTRFDVPLDRASPSDVRHELSRPLSTAHRNDSVNGLALLDTTSDSFVRPRIDALAPAPEPMTILAATQ